MTTHTTPAPGHAAPPPGYDTPASVDRLESEIHELSTHLAAGTCRLLDLVAAFDRLHGWADHGMRSCAAWLSATCGFGPSAARERVRVARAIESLPVMHGAFSRGELSYSKVRALTRIATPETEPELTALAVELTTAQIERMCRRSPKKSSGTGHGAGILTWRQDADGMVLVEGRFAREQFEDLLAGLAEAHDAIVADVNGGEGDAVRSTATAADPTDNGTPRPTAPAASPAAATEGATAGTTHTAGALSQHREELVWVAGRRTGRASVEILIRMLHARPHGRGSDLLPAHPSAQEAGTADVAA